MDRSTLATMCRYIAMIFAVLVMSVANIGTAWGETCATMAKSGWDKLSNTSRKYELGTGFYIYDCSSDGDTLVYSSTKYGNTIKINDDNTKGYAISDRRLLFKFPEKVSSITIYGYGTTARSVSSIKTNSYLTGRSSDRSLHPWSAAMTITTDYTTSASKDASNQQTLTINFVSEHEPDAGKYIWVELTNGLAMYSFCYTPAEAPSTCSSAYSFHYGPNGGSWETPICFTQVGETHEWNIENFTIPSHANGEFWVGYAGATNGQSVTKRWTDDYSESAAVGNGAMLLLPTTGSKVGQASGATGTLSIWDNSSSKNQYVGFKPDGYAIMYGGNNYAFSETATSNVWETDLLTLPDVSTTYQVGIKTSSSYTTCSHSKSAEALSTPGNTTLKDGKKYIYLNAGVWRTNAEGRPDDVNEKMAVWDATNVSGEWGNGGNFLTYNKATGLYEGYVSSSTTKIVLTRINNSRASLGNTWGDGVYNQTYDITLTTTNNEFTITAWHDNNDDKKPSTHTAAPHSHPATGDNGKFRMYDNSNDANWYVHWIPYYKLSYDGNGGTGSVDPSYRNSELSTSPLIVAANGFTREGWRFAGWNTNKYGTGTDYAPGDNIDITGDQTLYAKWERDIYLQSDVSWWYNDNAWFAVYCFDSEHDTNYKWVSMTRAEECSSPAVYKVALPGNNFDKVIFCRMKAADTETLSWDNKDNQTSDIAYPSLVQDKFTITNGDNGNACTGTWGSYAIPTYTISYNAGTNGSGSKASEAKTCNVDFTLPSSAVFTRTGYTQTGWTTSNGGAQTHALGGSYTTNADQTFYPVWTAKSCDITFDKNDGSGGSDGTSATYDATMTSITAPTRAGYDFGGYYDAETDDNGSGTKYYNANGTNAKTWDKNTTSTTTLYAKWTAHTYTVNLDHQGGSCEKDTLRATYNATLPNTARFETPTKDDYTFIGYYSQPAGTGDLRIITQSCKWNSSTKSGYLRETRIWDYNEEEDPTLYARWDQTVTLDANGGEGGSITATWNKTTLTITAPTYTDHTIDGYYAESGCTNLVANKSKALQASVTVSTVPYTDSDSKWIKEGSTTLYAHWKCDKPTISFSNDVTNTVTITIPSGTTVYYTTDGSMPTGSSTEYTEPFTIDANKTIKAIAIQSGCTNSDVKSQTCTYTAPTYYNVSHSLINVTKSSGSAGANAATESVEYTAVFAAAENYILPATITVTIGGESATAGSDYTWSQRTGTVTIPGSNVTGNIAISISGVAAADNYWNEFVWKKSADYGGDGKCMDSDDANTLSTIVSGVITTNQSSATIVGGKDLKMDRPTSKGTDFVLTFDVGPADYYISSLCTYGKIEESAGAYYSWDGGENWTNIAQYSSDQTKTFDAPDATYPTSFIIKYTCTSTSSGGIYWRNAQVELAPIPAACSTPAAPTAFSAGSITSTGATFSITDAGDAASYDIYYSTSSDTPTASTPATTTSTSKTKAVTGLTASTTYYAWVRSVCDADHKSAWVAGSSFTTSAVTYTLTTGAVTTIQPEGESTVGGSISASAASAAAGTTITLTATPTSADYVHTSWTVTKASSGTVEVSNNQFTMPAEAVTVTATFTRKYLITYLEDDNSTEIDGLSPTYYLYGVGATLPTPTKSGYTFADWYSQWCVYEDYEAPEGPGYGWVDGCKVSTISTTDYGNATYLAKWTANNYTITYHLNGASWASSAGVAEYTCGTGATLPVAGDMTNTGYTFGGWFADDDLKTGGVKTEVGTSEYGNKEFWAKWTENTYDVTYNANGGTGTTAAQNGHYITLRDNGFTAPSGKTFVEWNTANDGSGDSYNPGEEVELTANLALYAIWATDYTITWDAKAKLSGVAVTPNLGGGNYTITASVAIWNGTLTAGMISALTDGVTITNVEIDDSASPKTITATFNVGASVVGESISFTLDVPAAGVYGAKSDTEDFDIDRCTGSSSGSDGVLFSAEFKDSGLGTSDICTAANTDYTFTTSELKAAPTGGSIKASTTSTLSHMKFATNAISIAGSDGVIRIDLDNAIATNDLFTYVNVNSSSSAAYLRHTSPTTTTDQIALTVYNSKEAKVRLTSGFNGKTTLYIVRNSSNFNLHKAAVIRPAFLMLMRDDTPTESSTNLSGTDVALTTDNYLAVISGGSATFTSPTSGNLKIKRNNSKNYINFNSTAGYVKIELTDALQEGDVIGFDSYNTNNLALTTTATRSTSIVTTNQLYTVGASSDLKGATTFYLWQNSGSSDFLRGLQIARSGVAGGGGGTDKITTTLTWTPTLSLDVDWHTDHLEKETGDADFTFTASQDKNSLGAITYSSNNTSVATVNASGKVHIAGAGNATITATMAASGCYKEATVSYNITVTDNCADVAGTISTEDLDCLGVKLTVTGHTTSGKTVSYQWYKDGGAIDGATSDNYTATAAGEYYVIVTNTGSGHCSKASTNTITLEDSEAATASKIVDQWYVKNGRRTPDIALVQTEGAESFIVKSGDSPITTFAGCAFYLGTDGIIYLKGQQEDGSAPTGLTSGDETLKFTATACGGNSSELSITIHKQESTTRPSVAFVVDGTKDGAFNAEDENHSVNTELYQYLDYGADMTGAFDLTGQNVYSTVDEQAIREHYSQFDAILITDDPSTDTKSGKKSYVDAFGTMIDVRPILTMEAFVSKWGNWKAKGIDGNPESPNPRQYKMKLQCKDHAIFKDLSVGTNVETETIDGVEYWTVTMVDNTKSPYSGVADGTDTKDKPALQGFSADDVNSLLLLGQISGGSLYAGVERQEETAARLMLLGLNAKALPNALTPEGKKVIENALKYLIETDLEKVDDCSNYFTGATDKDWNKDSNWSKNHVPNSPNVRVRILSECVIYSGTYKVAEVDIATSGKSLNKAGEMTGKLTINAGAALIVGGKVRTAEAPYFNTGDLKPTTEEDLVINTSSTAQAALIFNNDAGDTKATVSFYSLGRNDGAFKYQYIASPMEVVPVSESYHGSGVYTYVYTEAGGWERRGYYTDLYAFEGVAITTRSATATEYTVSGTLAHTNEREIDITVENGGDNMIGNSWTAPIQISELSKAPNTATLASSTVYVYCSGRDATLGTGASGSTEVAGQWLAVPFNAASFKDWTGLKVIPAMNAFEFLATAAGTITLNYDTLVRGGSQYDLTAKARAPKRIVAHEGIDLVRIRVADTKTHNDIHLFEGDVFSEAFDDGWEAKYMTGEGISAQLYAMNGEDKMAVLATSTLEGTVLGFAPGREREYTFSFLGADNGYYLNDLKLKTSTPISETEHYTFTYEEGDTNRFYISRTPIDAPQTPTGVDNTRSGEVKAKKFIYNDKMYIMINGRVYSAEGQIVK